MATKELNSLQQKMKENGDEHYSALVTGPNLQITKLPEAVFIQVFLPYFCGEKNIADDTTIMPNWIGIAGAPGKEVDIVDTTGKVLFRVPPMNDNEIIDTMNKKNGQNFNNIIANYQLHNSVTPTSGANYLNNAFGERLEKLRTESPSYSENEKRWYEIFTKYGKAPEDKAKETLTAASKRLSDEEISYD